MKTDVPEIVYGTHQLPDHQWRPPHAFENLEEALEILEFFCQGRPWLISNERESLEVLIEKAERNFLAEEIHAYLNQKASPHGTR